MIKDVDDTTWNHRKHIAGIRKCFVHAILDLQKEHRAEGISDPKGLACMAKRCTKHSIKEAATRGKEMEKEAKNAEKSHTLDILNSVLDMIGVCDDEEEEQQQDSQVRRKYDSCLNPPQRLVSPTGNPKPQLHLSPDGPLSKIAM